MKTTITLQLRNAHSDALAATGNRSAALNALIPRVCAADLPALLTKRLSRPVDYRPSKPRCYCLDASALEHLQAMAHASGFTRDEVVRLAIESMPTYQLPTPPNPSSDPTEDPSADLSPNTDPAVAPRTTHPLTHPT